MKHKFYMILSFSTILVNSLPNSKASFYVLILLQELSYLPCALHIAPFSL